MGDACKLGCSSSLVASDTAAIDPIAIAYKDGIVTCFLNALFVFLLCFAVGPLFAVWGILLLPIPSIALVSRVFASTPAMIAVCDPFCVQACGLRVFFPFRTSPFRIPRETVVSLPV